MTSVAVITTTINVPTNLRVIAEHVPPWCELSFVVAGDVQTPYEARELVDDLGGVYLGVDDELSRRWRSHDAIGLRSIQRRNLALLHAIAGGADVIVTVDDDNTPHDPTTYLASFVDGLHDPIEHLTSSSTSWYNPGHVLDPPVTHRGYPISQRHRRGTYHTFDPLLKLTMAGGPNVGRVGVVAGLWFGDPDVDALERIVNAPDVRGFRMGGGSAASERGVVLDVGTWAPFNTQNTAYAWEVAPLMQCLVGVGRFDDIWSSYVARRVMDNLGWRVRYGRPIATQARNEHDLLRDLRAELLGYERTDDLVAALRDVKPPRHDWTSVVAWLEHVYHEIKFVFSQRTRRANDAWLEDAEVAVSEGTKVRSERVEAV